MLSNKIRKLANSISNDLTSMMSRKADKWNDNNINYFDLNEEQQKFIDGLHTYNSEEVYGKSEKNPQAEFKKSMEEWFILDVDGYDVLVNTERYDYARYSATLQNKGMKEEDFDLI